MSTTQTETLFLRVPPKLKRRLEAEAKRRRLTLNKLAAGLLWRVLPVRKDDDERPAQ